MPSPAPDARRWPARYTLVGMCFAASCICYVDRVNLSVAVLPMQDHYGWTEAQKGYVLSSFFVGYLLLQVASGWLANRYGGRRVLGLAVLWWSAFTILTPPAAALSFMALIAARIALGLGEAATYPSTWNLFGRWVPPTERSRAVSMVLSGIPLGTLFALSTTGWIVTHFGWPAAFYLFGAGGFVWAALWFARIHDDPREHPRIATAERALLERHRLPPEPARQVPWRRLLSQPAVLALIGNHFCSNWALYVLLMWLPSYFRETQGVSIAAAGLYSAAPWLTMFAVSNVAGWAADAALRRGVSVTAVRKTMQSIGLLGSAAFLVAAIDVDSAFSAMGLLCGALGCLACTYSGFAPNHLDIAPRYADVLMGVTNTFGTLPGIIGVAVTGALVDATGTYAAAFALTAAVNVAGTIVWLLYATGRKVID